MAGDTIFNQQFGAQGFDAQLADGVQVQQDRRGVLGCIPFQKCRREWPRIEHDVIKHLPSRVFVKGLDMVCGRVAPGFARLGHQVANQNFSGACPCNFFGDAFHE